MLEPSPRQSPNIHSRTTSPSRSYHRSPHSNGSPYLHTSSSKTSPRESRRSLFPSTHKLSDTFQYEGDSTIEANRRPSFSTARSVSGTSRPGSRVSATASPLFKRRISSSAERTEVPVAESHSAKRSSSDGGSTLKDHAETSENAVAQGTSAVQMGSKKRAKAPKSAVKIMPARYETCNVRDLVSLIANMMMELVRFNDEIPLRDGGLTRFHSRAPPGISVIDYLQRLTTHATLSPPILLSMVYYIDRLCALYPAFTLSSLTVHRFLIASATVASKGLSDSFWTNSTYARVGGVSLKELALLELEFLWRLQWKIVPKPEMLVDYYRSLVERDEGYEMESEGDESGPSKSQMIAEKPP